MVKNLKVAVLAGALALVAAPAFAQDMVVPGLDQLGAGMNGMMSGMDLDPFHIFTPAPAPAAAPAPMMKKPMMHKHMMMHHKMMMMHHKKMMMHHKMMMKKAM